MSTQSTSQYPSSSYSQGSFPQGISSRRPAGNERHRGSGVSSAPPPLAGPAYLSGNLPTPVDNAPWLAQVHAAMNATVSDSNEGSSVATKYYSPLSQLLATIPPPERMEDIKRLLHPSFRMRCFDVLLSAFETATKIVGVESAIKALEKQRFENKLPAAVNPIARAKVSTQFTSLYPAEMREKSAQEMAAVQAECAAKLHGMIIDQTNAELEFLKDLNSFETIERKLSQAISRDFQSAKLQYGSRPGQEAVNMELDDTPTESRDQRDIAGEIQIPPCLLVERDAALALAPLLAGRVLEMARTRQANKNYALEKKISLKERTVLRVAQEAPETEDARIVRILKGFLLKDKKQGKKTKNVRGIDHPVDLAPLTFLGQENSCPQRKQTSGDQKIERKRKREGETPIYSSSSVIEEEPQEEAFHRRKRCREESETMRPVALPFSFDHPSSYPDEILRLPPYLQDTVLVAKANSKMFSNLRRFWPGPHVQEGISVPDWVKYELGVNMKYLYPVTFNKDLLEEAYNDFIYRIRWNYFWFKRDKHDDKPWDPTFAIPKERKIPTKMSHCLERGIDRGRQTLISMCVKPFNTRLNRDRRPRWKQLSEFLESHKLMIKGSDKNLGPVIFERDWYVTEVEKLLQDKANYNELDSENTGRVAVGGQWVMQDGYEFFRENATVDEGRFEWLANTIHEAKQSMERFIEFAKPMLPDNEYEFIKRWSVDADVLRFHGIPKIHKTLWKIRLIAPGHSWITSPLAKWVQVQLRDTTKAIPWIAQSTKDVVSLLDLVELPARGSVRKNIYVCTGDVVAMYPNVPRNSDMIIYELLKEIPDFVSEAVKSRLSIIQRAISIVNSFSVVEFNGRFYAQMKGLAMGAACSPDVANLYAAYYEIKNQNNFLEKDVNGNGVLFYCRYIDDVLSIIQADSLEHLRAILNKHNLGPTLQVEWAIAREGEGPSPFLNLDIDILTGETRVDFKLFRKPFNHFMRIPWESSHPVTVKRAGFQGELTRIATCSSRREFYDTAVAEYMELLTARGYPRQVLHSWARNEVEKRWGLAKTKLKLDYKGSPPMIFKTEYNDVWNGIDINKVKATILESWVEQTATDTTDRKFAEAIRDKRFLISYKRTRNLQDDVSILNAKLSQIHIDDFREIVDRGANDFEDLIYAQRREDDESTDDDDIMYQPLVPLRRANERGAE